MKYKRKYADNHFNLGEEFLEFDPLESEAELREKISKKIKKGELF